MEVEYVTFQPPAKVAMEMLRGDHSVLSREVL
jgi:hypothetical protein